MPQSEDSTMIIVWALVVIVIAGWNMGIPIWIKGYSSIPTSPPPEENRINFKKFQVEGH
jgi:hypothetical protein